MVGFLYITNVIIHYNVQKPNVINIREYYPNVGVGMLGKTDGNQRWGESKSLGEIGNIKCICTLTK